MYKKPDEKGGNSNIYFTEDSKAKKFLRNNSSKEKIDRFKLELEIMRFFKDNPIDGGNSPQNLDKFWRAIYYEINR